MKKLLFFLILSAFLTIFFSCATTRSGLPDSRGNDAGCEVVTMNARPDPGLQSVEVQSPVILLPEYVNNRAEVQKSLKEYSAKFINFFKTFCKALFTDKTGKSETSAAETPVRKQENHDSVASKETTTPYVNQSPPAVVDPPVHPVVNTPPVSSSYDQGRTSDRVRTVYARKGDDVEISFKENGWLLLEMPKEGGGLEYISRSSEDGKTLFKFHGKEIGNFTLPFQYQDLVRGIMRREIIEIKVVPENEFDAALGSRESEEEKEMRAKKREYADKLYDLGKFKEAFSEYLASYTEGDPGLNEKIATLALLDKDYWNAVNFWKKNIGVKGAFHDKSVIGLVRAYMGMNDKSALVPLIKMLFEVKDFSIEEEEVALVRYFNDLKEDSLAFDLLEEYLARFPLGNYLDEVYFLLGKLFEYNPLLRDFKKARECYTRVVKEHPESAFVLPARERIDFINRHYFRVQ